MDVVKDKEKISIIVVGCSDNLARKMLFLNFMLTLVDPETKKPYSDHPLEVIVVDDHLDKNAPLLPFIKIVDQPKPFNYNACLNEGAKHATGKYLYFANNDLLFTPKALDELVTQTKRHRLGSASAICPKAHANSTRRVGVMKSYKVGTHFTGWGFMLTRKAYEAIDGLRENCPFYCADNETVEQLKEAGIVHGLVLSAAIEHVGQQTQNDLDNKTAWAYTVTSVEVFNELYNQNIFGLNNKDKSVN